MKPSDIIIGQKYTHKNHTHTVYLGIGIQSPERQQEMSRKALLILSTNCVEFKYHTVIWFKNDKSSKSFWDGFEKVS